MINTVITHGGHARRGVGEELRSRGNAAPSGAKPRRA